MASVELKKIIKIFESKIKIISTERDKIKELQSEIETLLDSFDRGIEAFTIAKEELENGLEALSEYT